MRSVDTYMKKITIKKNCKGKDFTLDILHSKMIDRYHKTLPSKTKSSSARLLYSLLFVSFRVVSYGLAIG